MKSQVLLSLVLLCSSRNGNAHACYYHARLTPMHVDYNFELRNHLLAAPLSITSSPMTSYPGYILDSIHKP